jgi:xylulose-5-phosphate/fructose-6-phosphate phosphoketolase
MDDKELACLFTGYGYQVRFVEELAEIDLDLATSLEWAYKEIRRIQKAARSGAPIFKPRWPVLIMRTPKGWGAPAKVHGELVEGSFRSHQVPLPAAKTDAEELRLLQKWLKSYNPSEIFDSDGNINANIEKSFPINSRRLGQNQVSNPDRQLLKLQNWHQFAVPIGSTKSCLKVTGEYLAAAICDNPHSLRIFSPDELVSNKLDAVFRYTCRNFQWDQYSCARGGQVVEILSEHTCQGNVISLHSKQLLIHIGFLQGYTMTGRTGLFPTYESFLSIVATMMVQFAKFRKVARAVHWRNDLNSITYISTSVWTRQEHNGLSHQNPGFIGVVLDLKPEVARVYLPPDANCFLSTFAHCLRSKNYVNLIVGSKQPQPVWLSPTEADEHCRAGGSVWKFASTDEGLDPDVVLVGIGADVMFEVIAGAALLRQMVPYMRVRVVNVTDLMILGPGHPHSLSFHDFQSLFTTDKHINFNYHGYVKELQGLLFGRPQLDRVTIQGYQEEGTTTTPFDMVLRNQVSRYHVAIEAVKGAAVANERVRLAQQTLLGELGHKIAKASQFIVAMGTGRCKETRTSK